MRIVKLGFVLFIVSCSPKEWKFEREIVLDTISPVGITEFDGAVWVSDVTNNRIVKLTKKGAFIEEISGLDRPMHLSSNEEGILVPEYGKDSIAKFQFKNPKAYLDTPKLDAPAGVHQVNETIAIADFYNHRILFYHNNKWQSIGKKGVLNSEFNYPTDVQIMGSKMYVADAYNHRIQVFDNKGKHIQTFGKSEQMNATTGIYVTPKSVFATDFENNRVLEFNLKGKLKEVVLDSINKPTDIILIDKQLWVLNFKKGSISVYSK